MAQQSYSHLLGYPTVNSSGALVAIAIDGTNLSRTKVFTRAFKLVAVRAHMQTAYTGATASVITVAREKEGGTTTNAVSIGTFTIPVTAALGDVYLVDVNAFGDTDLAPGESVSFTSNGGADATTSVNFEAVGYEYPEPPNPVASFTTEDKPRSGTGDLKYLAATEA